MSNSSIAASCLHPFLALSDFPHKGGFEGGRLCTETPGVPGMCCMPCPFTSLAYPDNFDLINRVADWIGVGALVCCIVLLISFAVLPVQKTSRHYLTISLIFSIVLMTLAFVIPLGSKPNQCFDAITPNDMRSDLSCALTGAFVVGGGFSAVMWVFIRTLYLFLQICCQFTPGKKFFWGALVAGWGMPALILAVSLAFSGVSYRFGSTCHINHNNAIATFWGPLLAFAGMATALQFATFAYCIKVYIRSLNESAGATSVTSSTLPSLRAGSSLKTMSARAAYRRVRKVVALQWRGMTVVTVVIVSVIYFSVVFLKMDNSTSVSMIKNKDTMTWVTCLVFKSKDECLPLTSSFIINQATVMSVLFLIVLNGYWAVLCLGRVSMIPAWIDLIRAPFASKEHFVSVDARRMSDPRNYEMLTSPQQFHMIKGPNGLVATQVKDLEATTASSTPAGDEGFDYFQKEPQPSSRPGSQPQSQSRPYRTGSMSFCRPQPPSRSVNWPTSSIYSESTLPFARQDRPMTNETIWPSPSNFTTLNRSTSLRSNPPPRQPTDHRQMDSLLNAPQPSGWDPTNTYAPSETAGHARGGALSPEPGPESLRRSPEPAHIRGQAYR